ncbi:MAG: hypothetical protein IKP64_04075, partial [Selenomonadaceae bacterium]|nr:hypothetical protein [Selenomonadaceae bacterium]
ILYPHAVREAVEYLASHPECGLVYGSCDFIDAQGKVIGHFNAKQTDYRKLTQGYVHIPQQASFWRADLWKQVGPLDDSIYFAMDYDLWLRLAKVSEIKYLAGKAPWAAFRLHADAKTIAEDDRCWPDMLRIHQRNGGSIFSVIYAKYCLRKLLAPLIRWNRRRNLSKPDTFAVVVGRLNSCVRVVCVENYQLSRRADCRAENHQRNNQRAEKFFKHKKHLRRKVYKNSRTLASVDSAARQIYNRRKNFL